MKLRKLKMFNLPPHFTCVECNRKQLVVARRVNRRPSYNPDKPDFVHVSCVQCRKSNKINHC